MTKDKLYYNCGNEIKVGDVVEYLGDDSSKIVFVVTANRYSVKYPKNEWSYLKEGFGIETKNFGLVHQIEADNGIRLIKRENVNTRERISKIEIKARELLKKSSPELPDETA